MLESNNEIVSNEKVDSHCVELPKKLTIHEYIQNNIKERKEYIDSLYGAPNKHNIYVRVSSIREKFISFKAKYFLRPDGMAIEFIPFKDEDYTKVGIGLKYLISKEIYCPVHWPKPKQIPIGLSNVLYEQELSLVCDQRYDKKDMMRIAVEVLSFMESENNA